MPNRPSCMSDPPPRECATGFCYPRAAMPESRFAPLLRPELAELAAYAPHHGHFEVRLDANEAPALLSPEANLALARAMAPTFYNRYPDVRANELRAALADRTGAEPDEILLGIGSDEVIAMLLTAIDRPRPGARAPALVTPTPTFVMYKLSGRVRGFQVLEVPLDDAWDLDVPAMKEAIARSHPNVVFIASPNNPTSTQVSRDRLEAVIEAAEDALVVLDEAYVAFSPRSDADLRRRYPNVAVLGTISKIGFAALRLGWLIGPAELMREVDKVRQPYNLPVPTQRGAAFVLRELAPEVSRAREIVVSERERLAAGLAAVGLEITKSAANFLWARTVRPASEVWGALAERGILVKSFHATGGRMLHQVRITVGLPEENDRLLREIGACV
jgi:histidinol-phosphate aminotransferase